jgi:uncharacterized protein with FMN-binding domain
MEEPTQQPKQSKTLLTVILAAAVVILGGIIAFASGLFNSSSPASQTGTTTTPTDTTTGGTTPTTTPTTTSSYKDGTYKVDQAYQSPGGNEKFNVSLTLANGVVTAATFTPEPVSGVGKMKQAAFSAAFQPQVVGKNIDDISIGVLAGASLTSAAFMQALANVKAQAKA